MEAVRVSDFSFSYAGGANEVLSHAGMQVDEGAFCLIVGDAGSGKTTLLRCMCPALAPEGARNGSISIFDRNVDALKAPDVVGYVYQDPDAQIVCDKVWRELAFGLENMGMERSLMHRRVAEVATHFGIGPIFNRDCATLSGGQKQTLNLASVIAMNPKLLLLDEPTSQLDPISSQRLIDVIMRINRAFGTTVIVSTHAPEQFANIATCMYEIQDGRLRERDVRELSFGANMPNPHYTRVIAPVVAEDAPTVISLKDVVFSYAREAPDVLRQLSIVVREREIVSLVGANASGKTTLLKTIAAILRPQSGKVSNLLREGQAYLPQDAKLLFSKDSVIDELLEWSKTAGYSSEDAMALADRFGLAQYLESNPFDLSSGQQQKLAIAKTLLCSPKLMLFDEPTKGLDGKAQLEIANILMDASAAGATIVIATHDLSFASRVSDKMALVFNGEIACVQDSKSFCEGNLFYVPFVTRFSELWDKEHNEEDRLSK